MVLSRFRPEAPPLEPYSLNLYDQGSGVSPRMSNISARNRVGTGSDVLIAGFNLSGSGSKNVLIRGVGPGLAQFGITGFLTDPKIQVFDNTNALIGTNDNWDSSLTNTFNSVGAFALTAGSKDAAIIVTLRAGVTYSVVVSGADGGSGEGIVEIYELP
jgi:hypothetical protein